MSKQKRIRRRSNRPRKRCQSSSSHSLSVWRDWLADFYPLAQAWVSRNAPFAGRAPMSGRSEPAGQTATYADLIFAFGIARLGGADAARDFLGKAKAVLWEKDKAHSFLYSAYEYRVELAIQGRPHAGPLPEQLLTSLDTMDRLDRYVIDRFRQHSLVLEPDERINPVRGWGTPELRQVAELTDRAEGAQGFDFERFVADAVNGSIESGSRIAVISAALSMSPRVGEVFARKALDLAAKQLDENPEKQDRIMLLGLAMFVAGYFRLTAVVTSMMARFDRMILGVTDEWMRHQYRSIAPLCLRSLRAIGKHDQLRDAQRHVAALAVDGHDFGSDPFRTIYGVTDLTFRLHVASIWYALSLPREANPIMEQGLQFCRQRIGSPRNLQEVAIAYLEAAGVAPVELCRNMILKLFQTLEGVYDTYTVASHCYLSQLRVVENGVLAVLSRAGKGWLFRDCR